MEKKQTREDTIEAENGLNSMKQDTDMRLNMKEEVIGNLKSRPFDNSMWKDIGETWKIKKNDIRVIIKSD